LAKVTSKLQVTIPKSVADRYSIVPGDDIVFEPAGDVIRVVLEGHQESPPTDRLGLLERLLARQREREAGVQRRPARNRGWTREDLYDRGRAR
jgi:AbrB family looped-hinge helix DNA binding protein